MTNKDRLNRKYLEKIEIMLGYLLMEYWDDMMHPEEKTPIDKEDEIIDGDFREL